MEFTMLETALSNNKDELGIEDFELVYENEMWILRVDFKNHIWATVYSTGSIQFGTKVVSVDSTQLQSTTAIIISLAKHMEKFHEVEQARKEEKPD